MKKIYIKIPKKYSKFIKNIDKLARFHTNKQHNSAVIEVKTANSFNLFTITKYNSNNKILSNRQDRLRYKNKIKSSSIITKI